MRKHEKLLDLMGTAVEPRCRRCGHLVESHATGNSWLACRVTPGPGWKCNCGANQDNCNNTADFEREKYRYWFNEATGECISRAAFKKRFPKHKIGLLGLR